MNIVNTYLTILPAVDNAGIDFGGFVGELSVLTQDDCGLFAVYRAAVDHTKCNDERRDRMARAVAHGGEKLGYRRALCYFPNLERDEYRD
tara:strand:- start:190 stop:459 length:270 start_codon:yes stop_codon:yes gene_type:complete